MKLCLAKGLLWLFFFGILSKVFVLSFISTSGITLGAHGADRITALMRYVAITAI